MSFQVMRHVSGVGRVMKTGNTLFVSWNKPSMRDKFPKMKWDYTHWSDIDTLASEMIYASLGKYFALRTAMFKDACSPVPAKMYGY